MTDNLVAPVLPEKATRYWDLPHELAGVGICRCGRPSTDGLHQVPAQIASTEAGLVTEKGVWVGRRSTVAVDPRDLVLEGQLTIYDVLDSVAKELSTTSEVRPIPDEHPV